LDENYAENSTAANAASGAIVKSVAPKSHAQEAMEAYADSSLRSWILSTICGAGKLEDGNCLCSTGAEIIDVRCECVETEGYLPSEDGSSCVCDTDRGFVLTDGECGKR